MESIKVGVATGDEVQKIFCLAKEKKFALPAVNVIGSNTINGVLETASSLNAPVIIQFSNGGAIFNAGKGLSNENQNAAINGAIAGARHVHELSKAYNVPVILHTDHAAKKLLPWIDGLLNASEKNFELTGKSLFSSHMIDLSEEPIEENISICKEYLKRMDKIGMTLEIELGITGGEEDGVDNTDIDDSKLYTQPEEVAYAYEELSKISKRFTIAAAFGNVHGVYKPGNVKLTPKILKNSQDYVSQKFNLPNNTIDFVFHGGSGSSIEEEFRNAWASLGETLAAAGVGYEDIIDTTLYMVDLQKNAATMSKVKDEFIHAPYPASTWIGITELVIPGAHAEIKVIARRPN